MKTKASKCKEDCEDELLFAQLFSRPWAEPRGAWEEVFQRADQGFSGADGDSSLLLDDHRSLWLFGDTLVGPRDERSLVCMPRNSVGILPLKGEKRKFKFYWRYRRGKPVDFLPPVRPGEWLWPGTACMVNGTLHFFLHRFRTDNTRKYEALRFRHIGFHSLCVDNPQDSPDRWSLRPGVTPKLARAVYWGIACFAGSDGYVYLLGGSGGHREKGTVVARCPVEHVGKNPGDKWEYYGEGSSGPTWKRHARYLRPLFPDRSPEMSLSYLEKQKVYVAVYGPPKTNTIALRIARRIMGPWSRRWIIYKSPDSKWHRRYFSYAPKAHPELSPKGDELLVTYITNAYESKYVFQDQRIYYPRFVSLPLSE